MTDTHPATIDAERSLGDLVAERPGRARVLEARGIDYCCHGHRSLDAAATAAGLDVGALVAELAAVVDAAGSDVDGMEPAELAGHIESVHHGYLHEELPALEALAAKVAGVHGDRHAELADVARLTAALRADLEPHLAKEERVLFPAIRQLAEGPSLDAPFRSIADPIRVLMDEHVQTGALLAELRTTARDYAVPDDACASYSSLYERLAALEADTFRHIHLENNVLFPAAAAAQA